MFSISEQLRDGLLRAVLLGGLLAGVSVMPPRPANADALGDCNEGATPAARITGCSLVIEMAPSQEVLAIALMNRAIGYAAKGQLKEALADLDASLEASPGMTAALYNRGNVNLDLGRTDAAISDFGAVIEAEPQFALAWLNRGIARQQAGNIDGARSDFERALSLDQKLDAARRALARLKRKR